MYRQTLKTFTLEQKLMIKLSKFKPGNSLLDIGCGSGVLSMILADTGLYVTGIDSSMSMVENMQKKNQKVKLHSVMVMLKICHLMIILLIMYAYLLY